jgi:hypothetical protein
MKFLPCPSRVVSFRYICRKIFTDNPIRAKQIGISNRLTTQKQNNPRYEKLGIFSGL